MVPPLRLVWSAEKQCRVKNEEAVSLLRKSERFWDSLAARVRELQAALLRAHDTVPPEAASHAAEVLTSLLVHVQHDRHTVRSMLQHEYWDSPAAALLTLNEVRRALLNKSVEWDALFLDYERRCLPTEKEIRRLTTSNLKKLFAEREEERDSAAVPETRGVESIAAEHEPSARRHDEPESSARQHEPDSSARQHEHEHEPRDSEVAAEPAELETATPQPPPAPPAPPTRDVRKRPMVTNHRGEPMIVPDVSVTREPRESTKNTQVSSLAREFDRISREAAEREREMQLHMMRTRRARPVTTTHATVEVFKSLHDAVGGDESDSDSEWDSAARQKPSAAPLASSATPTEVASVAEYADVDGHAAVVADSVTPTQTSAAHDAETQVRHALFTALAATWVPDACELRPLEYPFPATDHLSLIHI